MRILYVTHRLPYTAGETFIIPEITELLAQGHEVLIVPVRPPQPVVNDDAHPLVPRTHAIPFTPSTIGAALFGAGVTMPARTVGSLWLARRSWDLVPGVAAALKGVYVARLARRWGAEHIHAHWANKPATLAMTASALTGIPWSFTAHRYDIVANDLLAEKLAAARFGRFIAQNALELAAERVPPAALRKAIVLPMGVELGARPAPGERPRARPVVMWAANLIEVKGHRYLLEAAALLKGRGIDVELRLPGDGEMRNALRQHISALGLDDRVTMPGRLPHREVLSLYRAGEVDCVAAPSLDMGGGLREGLPVTILEAMSYGIPIVATNTAGIPEAVEDGVSGLLVPQADATALADALQRVLQDRAMAAALGAGARARVERQFAVERVVKELVRRFSGAT